MSADPAISAALAEQLLDGSAAPQTPLARLLATARPVPSSEPIAGLDAALAAFAGAATASLADAPRPRSHPLGRLSTKLLAAVAAVTVAAGGVAVAASTGHLPNPLTSTPTTDSSSSARVTPTGTDGSASRRPTPGLSPGSGNGSASGGLPSGTTTGTASPSGASSSGTGATTASPSLVGLCKAWLSRPSGAGKSDQSGAFSVLVAAAGGVDAVDTYCTALLKSTPTPTPTPTPTSTTPTSTTPTSTPATQTATEKSAKSAAPAGAKTKKNAKTTTAGAAND